MRRWITTISFLLLFAPAAFAQGHGGTLSFTPYGNGSSVNVYRAPCSGTVTGTTQPNGGIVGSCPSGSVGTFALLANVPTASIYADASGNVNSGYVYQLTTLCPAAAGCTDAQKSAGESTPTAQLAVMTPPPPKPGDPTGFSITGVN